MSTAAYKQHLQHCDCNRVMKQHHANVTRLEAQVERLEGERDRSCEADGCLLQGIAHFHEDDEPYCEECKQALVVAERDALQARCEQAEGLLRERSHQYHVSQKHQGGVTIKIEWQDCEREPCASDVTFLSA